MRRGSASPPGHVVWLNYIGRRRTSARLARCCGCPQDGSVCHDSPGHEGGNNPLQLKNAHPVPQPRTHQAVETTFSVLRIAPLTLDT